MPPQAPTVIVDPAPSAPAAYDASVWADDPSAPTAYDPSAPTAYDDSSAPAAYDPSAPAAYDPSAQAVYDASALAPYDASSGVPYDPGSTAPSAGGAVDGTTTSTGVSGSTATGGTSVATASGATASKTTASSTGQSDDPLLPVTFSDRELRDAAGVKPRPEPRKRRPPSESTSDDDGGDGDGGDGDGDKPRKRRKMFMAATVMAVMVVGGIATLTLLGRLNKGNYVIACKPEEVVAEQGRGFPPWGTRALADDVKWKPIKIPPEAECRERETEDESELSGWYLDMLVERASSLLTAREVTKIDDASSILEQALLHARAPERRDQRKEIERLLGDVGYWRASAKLRDAATALTDAAKQFDTAAAQRPRHVSDASAWATYVRKLVDELHAGPSGVKQVTFPPLPPPEHPSAPQGSALPIEPDPGGAGSGSAAPGSDSMPASPPDAGVPTGGVLL